MYTSNKLSKDDFIDACEKAIVKIDPNRKSAIMNLNHASIKRLSIKCDRPIEFSFSPTINNSSRKSLLYSSGGKLHKNTLNQRSSQLNVKAIQIQDPNRDKNYSGIY
jgi:hypothetical protein